MIPIPIALIASATSGGSTTATAIHDMVKPHSRSTVTKGASVGAQSTASVSTTLTMPSRPISHGPPSAPIACGSKVGNSAASLVPRRNRRWRSISTAVPARTTPQLHTGRLTRHRPR